MYINNCSEVTELNTSLDNHNIGNELDLIFGNEMCSDIVPNCDTIFGRRYQSNLLLFEADVLVNKILRHWVQVEEIILENAFWSNFNFQEVTRQIVRALELFRYCLCVCDDNNKGSAVERILKYTKLLGVVVKRWSGVSERLLNKFASSAVRDGTQPVCHYFHTYLDIRWIIITLEHLSDVPVSINFDALIRDLITVSYTHYKLNCECNLRQSAFICSCIKSLWLLLQRFAEKSQKLIFWHSFNEAIKGFDEVFVLWILYNVSTLQGYSDNAQFVGSHYVRVTENYALIETVLKSLNTKCVVRKENNEILLNCCTLIYPLISEWWTYTVKSEPYQILWEIFHKHINLPFVTCTVVESADELIDFVGHISVSTKDSYEHFLFMLKVYLSKNPNQWARIRGRIYSKLPNNKVKELTDVGLYKIALLFLCLCDGTNLSEISEKLMSLLQSLPTSGLIIHIQLGLAILHVRNAISVRAICLPLVSTLEQITEKREKFNLVRAYIDGFDGIFKAGNNYSLQQHVMISKWVQKYLITCSFSDLCYFLNILSCNIKVLRKDYCWTEWEPILKQHVLPGLKSAATSSNCPSQVGTVAALIDPSLSSDYVLIFTSDLIAVNVTCHYMIMLLSDMENYCGLPKNYETAILHAWTRCCLLNCEGIDVLSKNVLKIATLSEVLDTTINVRNPLCSFITSFGKCSTSKLTNQKEICEQCFGRLDSWIVPHLTSPSSEAITVHIYTCISLLFFHCAQLLYHKNRSSCLLNRLVNIFLLPANILMGKKPHLHVLKAVQRTWHLFMQGIYGLDGSNDAYIERTLRDMVARYVPLLLTDDSPILKCIKNEKLAIFIFERISSSFLLHTSRSSEINTLKALKIVQLALERSSSPNLILRTTLPAIFEVLLFHNNKGEAIDVIKYVAVSEDVEDLRECVKIAFITVTQKHLAFNTNQYFQFVNLLVKLIPGMMPTLLPHVKKQVVEVERMRGVGYDNILRQGLERLEMLLKANIM